MRKHHRQSNSAHLVPGKSSRTDGQGSFGGREDSDPSKNAVGCLNAYEQGTTSSGSSSAWDDDASSVEVSEESGGSSVINVDFGVFDMRTRDVDASMHLLDQLCPDKMNEVDRDALGAALHANPFTCVVRVDSAATDDNDDGDEEEEEAVEGEADEKVDDDDGDDDIYGLASVLDLNHDQRLASLRQFLRGAVWRNVAPGVPPTEVLTSVDSSTGRSRCVLLVGEYIRNVPLELTYQILSELLQRFKDASGTRRPDAPPTAAVVLATWPCMFAVLSKIQRTADAPENAKPDETAAKTKSDSEAPKKKRRLGGTRQEEFDMKRYVFWREEDALFYEHRDTKVATVAYRCRSQYDGQPEHEVPISLLYVVSQDGLLKALAEIKKRGSAQATVTRY